MIKKYLLYFTLSLNSVLVVTAHHGGGRTLTNITPTSTGISPITWIIFGSIFLVISYSTYWLFSKDKKSF